MNGLERRKVMCSVAFNLIAVTCVLWSLHALIEKTRDEVKEGKFRKWSLCIRYIGKKNHSMIRMAILDKISCCCHWSDWWIGKWHTHERDRTVSASFVQVFLYVQCKMYFQVKKSCSMLFLMILCHQSFAWLERVKRIEWSVDQALLINERRSCFANTPPQIFPETNIDCEPKETGLVCPSTMIFAFMQNF